MRVAQQKQEMEEIPSGCWENQLLGFSHQMPAVLSCHSPTGSTRGCRVRPCSAQDMFAHHQSHTPGTVPVPSAEVRGANPQTGLTKPSLSPISTSWCQSPPGLRCCPAQRDLAEPGDTPGENMHGSWGPSTSNTAGSRKREIWIKPCGLNFRISNQILPKRHLQTSPELWGSDLTCACPPGCFLPTMFLCASPQESASESELLQQGKKVHEQTKNSWQ